MGRLAACTPRNHHHHRRLPPPLGLAIITRSKGALLCRRPEPPRRPRVSRRRAALRCLDESGSRFKWRLRAARGRTAEGGAARRAHRDAPLPRLFAAKL
ncbi:unnamed protein product [Lampetra planeri]